MTIQAQQNDLFEFWPLNPAGPLPAWIVGTDFLQKALFEILPMAADCSAFAVRKALKVHMKKYDPTHKRLSVIGDVDQDYAVAGALFGSVKARSKLRDLVLRKEQQFTRFGQQKGRVAEVKPGYNIANLLWLVFALNPEQEGFVSWIRSLSMDRPDIGAGYYLTAEGLRAGGEIDQWPVDVRGIVFAQAILLLGAILPAVEMRDLFEAAADKGSPYFLPEARSSGTTKSVSVPSEEVPFIARLPRLERRSDVDQAVFQTSSIANGLKERLTNALREVDIEKAALSSIKPRDLLMLADESQEVFLAAIGCVNAYRDRSRQASEIEAECYERAANLFADALHNVQLSFLNVDVMLEQHTSGTEALDEAEYLNWLSQCSPEDQLLREWRSDVDGRPTLDQFEKLATVATEARNLMARKTAFAASALEFAAKSNLSQEVQLWLRSLSYMEVSSLLEACGAPCWIALRAIFFRFLAELSPEEWRGEFVRMLSSEDRDGRRSLLRFCDPTSAAFTDEIAIKRILAAERLRDILSFGPLAQIADPAVGLNDSDVVGSTVLQISALIVENLDHANSLKDLRDTPTPGKNAKEVEERFRDFVSAQVTMTGNFRKMREAARVKVFLPLTTTGALGQGDVEDVIARVASPKLVEEIVADVRTEGVSGKIERRHIDQLNRYLGQGVSLLEEWRSQAQQGDVPRRKSFRKELARLLAHLRISGEFGSLEWLEGEVSDVILEGSPRPMFPTLLGTAESVLDREWTYEDIRWAKDLVELPEFYSGDHWQGIDILGALLKWRSKDAVPTAEDVIDHLVASQQFSAALSLLDDYDLSAERREQLSESIRTAAKPFMAEIQPRLDELRLRFGDSLFAQASALADLEYACSHLDYRHAQDLCDQFEIELLDAEALEEVHALDEFSAWRVDELKRLLLQAGVTGFENRSSVRDLEALWSEVLVRRVGERAHIVSTSDLMREAEKNIPSLSNEIQAFQERCLSADLWLTPQTSDFFSEILAPATGKLKSWLEASPAFSQSAQDALSILVKWYIGYLIEQSSTIHALEGGDPVDSAMERILEISELVALSAEPVSCAIRLADVGERLPARQDRTQQTTPSERTDAPTQIMPLRSPAQREGLSPSVTELIEGGKWKDVATAEEISTGAEGTLANGIGRLAALMETVDGGDQAELDETCMAAAAMVGSEQSFMNSLSRVARLDIGFGLIARAMRLSGERVDRETWLNVVSRRPDLLKSLAAGTLPHAANKVAETLLNGTLGWEIADKLWDAATNTAEPQAIRAPLMLFLYERGSAEIVLRLAQKYEPTIKEKLEQLFDIRSVTINRPDLISVAHSLATQVAQIAKPGPFRSLVKSLPSTSPAQMPKLIVEVEEGIIIRADRHQVADLEIPITIRPQGLVPEVLYVVLFQEDDVSFEDGTRRWELAKQPVYYPVDYSVKIRLGLSWAKSAMEDRRDVLRFRVAARTLTGDLIQEDVACQVYRQDRGRMPASSLDDTSLWEFYPGVGNTPAMDNAFIGRVSQLEELHTVLISASKPSPVLLTGMRRIGKTSLLFALHKRFRQPNRQDAVTIYLSLAEKRAALNDPNRDVSSTFFGSIVNALAKRNTSVGDPNYEVVERLKSKLNCDSHGLRKHLQNCFDAESLADSLVHLSEKLLGWMGGNCKRVVFLIDEAETLIVPYQSGGNKRIELEQLLQSLREVSQTSEHVGILLSGSNHINVFAREYKNAFFGSCVRIELAGIEDIAESRHIISPNQVKPFVQFEENAIEYAAQICSGMPLFMWQLGATTASLVRSGPATRADVRRAVKTLVLDNNRTLPFKAYDILEPLEHMLGLRQGRDPDLLWMLLWRIANSSSLVAQEATLPFILDQTMLSLCDKDAWKQHLLALVELRILEMPRISSYRFCVPIFSEGFRAPRQWQEFNLRHQRAAL